MTSTSPWTPAKLTRLVLSGQRCEDKTYPSLQHSDIDHDIERAFNGDQTLESCGQVKIETKIRFKILFNSGCGDTRAHLDLTFDRGVVEPEHDGDQDDGEDEDDEEADADGDQQTSHHAVGCVDLHKVESEEIFVCKTFLKTYIWNVPACHSHKEDKKKGYEDISNLKKSPEMKKKKMSISPSKERSPNDCQTTSPENLEPFYLKQYWEWSPEYLI